MVHKLFDLTGRTALITGGSRGLGLEIARGIYEMGANVILVARGKEQLDRAVDSLNDTEGRAVAMAADVADFDAVPQLVERAVAQFGSVDILVNGAGISIPGKAEEFPLHEWRQVMDVNLNAAFMISREVGRISMIPRRKGRILNIASIGGLFGNPPEVPGGIIPYNASKAGMIGMTRAMACEWGCYDITVNALCPGFFITDMTQDFLSKLSGLFLPRIPLGRFGGEHDLVGPALLLVSDAGRHITAQTLIVDGGMTSAP